MFIDLELVKSQNEISSNFDVCIVGAGPAGIILAHELMEKGFDVALCEAGGMDFESESQSCYEGTVVGDSENRLLSLDSSRLRYFGGTTGHWGGYCRPLTPIDFNRDYVGDGQNIWPIEISDIDPYLKRTAEFLNLKPKFNDDTDASVPFRTVEFQITDRRRGNFSTQFVDKFTDSKELHVFLNANLVDIEGTNHEIKSAEFANYRKESFKINAKKFVFAMGGIETSRYMLWFSQKYKNKYFNSETPIGKYFMEHPHTLFVGITVQKGFKTEFPLVDYNSFLISDSLQRKNEIFGCNIVCHRKIDKKKGEEIMRDFRSAAPNFFKNNHEENTDDYHAYVIDVISEQIPNENNFISLTSKDKDKFGIPRVELNWDMREIDKKTIRLGMSEFLDFFMKSDVGRLKLHDDFINLYQNVKKIENKKKKVIHRLSDVHYNDGSHHMGTLRMFETPKYGVVDANCKVYGSNNLYICGSSVFTTSGVGNPTFPIIQMTLRLSDHLKQIL